MFKPVSSKPNQPLNLPLLEEQTLNFWKLHRTFARTSQLRQGGAEYVFYESPPTANGRPEVQHALARAFKDLFPRYKLMRGYHVVRRGGWDSHGLPVEIEVEKQLGFTNKAQIEAYGVERFNQLCRKSAFEFIQEWERFSDRLGFWVDMRDAYVTYTNEYIESVWWILKTFWERGLLYQAYKVALYCPRCGTPLSDHEVALGYAEAENPSVFVRLPLVDDPDTALLVWTTMPWTLPANVAVAAHPDAEYVTVERELPEGGKERLILARPLLEKVFGDESVRVVDAYKGRKLKGKRYKPLFTFLAPDKPAYFVVLQDYVTVGDGGIADGTGLAPIAPAFGAEDMQVALEADLPVLMTVKDDGTFIPEVRPWSGRFVKDADPLIIRDLEARGLLLRAENIRRPTAFCWRCDTPLLPYACSTWYLRTSQFKERLLRLNQEINWAPRHIKNGRFGIWLENSGDWALGRERYWGTPLPVWECGRCHHQLAVGSLAELSKLAGRDPAGLAQQSIDLHRPHIDHVTFPCPECAKNDGDASGGKAGRKAAAGKAGTAPPGMMKRVPDLVDVWFDAGSMPVAQWHFPFENRETFRAQYPADFVCEGAGQAHGWFYALHAISALLFDSVAYKNAISLGPILDATGQKMSSSRGNLVDPWAVLNTHGADALRWYLYTAAPPGQERRFSPELVGEVVHSFILPLWNTYSFFITNARLEKWLPAGGAGPTAREERSLLDRWVLSELHGLVRQVTEALDNYDVPGATRPIQAFVDDLSNWYLRRSRRRFWKGGSAAMGLDEPGSRSAYATLYAVLVTLSKLLAPTMPFLSETLYQNLVRSVDLQAPDSVHLCDWPAGDPNQVDEDLNRAMRLAMRLASLGHAARAQAGLKVGQPLAEAAFVLAHPQEAGAVQALAGLLADELNVKQVRLLASAGEVVSYTIKPLPKQLGQKYKELFPHLAAAIEALDPAAAAATLLAGQPVVVTLDDQRFEIQPDEVDVCLEPHPGLAVASGGPYLAALQTGLTPALVQEGLGGEFVRRVQELRKQAGLEIADRIHLQAIATPDLAAALEAGREYIMGELLAVDFGVHTTPLALPAEAFTAEAWFDGQWMKVGILPT